MNPTKLLYLENMQQLECMAYVETIEQQDGKTRVYLDQTVFYPQGGGQPYDTGTISNDDANFVVEEVRYLDGRVAHIGHFDGRAFLQNEDVTCRVDKERRELNTRLHSGGHLVDMAVSQLGYDWIPTKGYHFPEGSYVEYQGDIDGEDTAEVAEKIDRQIAQIVSQNPEITIKFVDKTELAALCRHVPDNIPKDKPTRIVLYGNFGVACGGTHVAEIKDIGSETVRKIKTKPRSIRISYQIG